MYSYDKILKKLTVRDEYNFPPVYDLCHQIEIMDLSDNHFKKLPPDLYKFKKIKELFLSNNPLNCIPPPISKLNKLQFLGIKSCHISSITNFVFPQNIRWITLTNNYIKQLPNTIGNLKKLEKLLLSGNKLKTLPKTIINCKKLSLLKISSNNFQKSPLKLLSKLPHLAWYADSGNPFYQTITTTAKITPINSLTIKNLIGQSAQNKIYQTTINKTGIDVALKVYGSQINSDGNAQDEINASLMAGKHPHLISAIGQVKNGLILPLLSPDFYNLGLPPSFDTCIRDTFPINTNFLPSFVLTVLKNISSAMVHLHYRGIMHGDIYAHNILVNKNGYSYLSDFGAATIYDPQKDIFRQSIDVLAFGYLIDDLLTHCPDTLSPVYKKIKKIQRLCQNPIESRPSFDEINQYLKRKDI